MALAGRFTEHHALLYRLRLDRIKVFDDAVDELAGQIAAKAAPWQRELDLLKTLPGFGDTVAQAWLALIGPAPASALRQPREARLLGHLVPGEQHQRQKAQAQPDRGNAGTYIKPMLVQAAWNAIRVRGQLQARYNRLVRRFGGQNDPAAKKKAITAIAHTLLKTAYQVLKSRRSTFAQDLGADFYTRRESPQQKQAYLERQLQKLHPGCTITVTISPPEGALPPRRLTSNPDPSQPGAAAEPGTPALPPDNRRLSRALATVKARVRCRRPARTSYRVRVLQPTVLILTTASPGQACPADLLALNRGHWAATETTHYIRDVDMKEDSSRARAPGAARFMATVSNAALNLLRIHGVTNIAAERRRLNGSDHKILKRMGLSTG